MTYILLVCSNPRLMFVHDHTFIIRWQLQFCNITFTKNIQIAMKVYLNYTSTQKTQNICITFIQCWTNLGDWRCINGNFTYHHLSYTKLSPLFIVHGDLAVHLHADNYPWRHCNHVTGIACVRREILKSVQNITRSDAAVINQSQRVS